MLLLAVVAQPFAVVGGHRDQEPALAGLQAIQQPAHQLVGVGDLAVVGVAAGVARRRGVRGVRLVEVEEGEEARVRPGLHPPGQRLHRHGTVALDRGQRLHGPLRLDRVIVEVEALRDPGLAPQHVGRDRGPRPPAGGPEAPGQGGMRIPEREAEVVAHSVVRRQEPGEEGGVSGQGEGAVAVHVLEHHPAARQRVEVRGGPGAVTVGREAVGPQGVDRDQHHGGVRVGAGRGRAAPGEEAADEHQAASSHQRDNCSVPDDAARALKPSG